MKLVGSILLGLSGVCTSCLIAFGCSSGSSAGQNGTPKDSGVEGSTGDSEVAGDSASEPPPGAEAGQDVAMGDAGHEGHSGVPCEDGAANACGAPTYCSPEVQPTYGMGSGPAPAGGSIAPGSYALTALTAYGIDAGIPFSTVQISLEIASSAPGMGQFSEVVYEDNARAEALSGNYSTSGVMLTRDETCPITTTLPSEYTSTATTITVFQTFTSPQSGTYQYVYTLQ